MTVSTLFARAVGRDDLVAVECGEHRATLDFAGLHRLAVAAGVHDQWLARDVAQSCSGEPVEAGDLEPVVQVAAADELGEERDRRERGEGQFAQFGEFVRDLHSGVAADDDPLPGEAAGIGQSTASEQLTLLRRGGIVTSRRDGKVVFYRADKDGMTRALADLQAYLEVCC